MEEKEEMEEFFLAMKMASSVVIVGIFSWILYVCINELYKCERIRRKLIRQGISGPSPSFLRGNLPDMQRIQAQVSSTMEAPISINSDKFLAHHDYTATIFPYFEHWRKQYGRLYTYSTGMKQHLYVNQPELVREINQCNNLDLGKPSHNSIKLRPLFGNGIVRANGLSWAHQRKLLAPEFFMDKVKGMVDLVIESAQPLLTKWEQCIEAQGYGKGMAEVKVDADLRDLSADVISRVCFGHSYSKGKEIFSKIRTLKEAISNSGYLFGLSRSGTWKQSKSSNVEKEIESLIWELVEERKASSSSEKDLMQSLLDTAKNDENQGQGEKFCKQFIVDNCKNIYLAGHETTAISASWSLMLLALNPEWQARIRAEVAQYCPNGIPDTDSLPLLKTVTMVIQEVLRLYPPGAFVAREAYEDVQIGNLNVPKGVNIWTLVATMHRDTEIWGLDADEFKPERFKDGVSKACMFPQSYAPFGLGSRLCVGKNLAMMELKIILALIMSNFEVSLSPSYKHSPIFRMLVEPEHGVHLLIQKV